MPIQVLLVDDHELVRRGLRDLLGDEPDIEVVAEASSVEEALAVAMHVEPEVAVVDVRLGDGDGITLCRELRSKPNPPACLMLTAFDDEEAMVGAIMAGAAGYLLKQLRGDEIVGAIRKVGSGLNLMDPARTQPVMARLRRGKHMNGDERLDRLSAQEEKVVLLVADGCTNREIGERLDLAEKTVKNYVSSVLRKLEVGRRAQAAAYLVRHTQPEA